ncbi:MAG: pyrroline-5-carboxylate reductase [Bermanella sp.]|jgi:pyrroline-5-carboxylate reductase
MTTIAFIGAGNMAGAILGGLINDGSDPLSIWACDPSQDKLNDLKHKFGIQGTTNNSEAIAKADVVILAVKPQVMELVLEPMQVALQAKKPLVISVAAGIDINSLAVWCGGDLPIVRCMPNTPSLVGQGASGLFANEHTSSQQKKISEDILNAVGISVWVKTEAELNAVTAVSGSGPAYYFLFMEAMINAGEKLGLSRETATSLTLKTALGAATMASESDLEASQLRRNVTSPNGTTEQAINTFIDNGLEALVEKALTAASNRSESLSEELGVKH